jgi:hypothetical protein
MHQEYRGLIRLFVDRKIVFEALFGIHLAASYITEFPSFFFDLAECNIMTAVHFWADMTCDCLQMILS